MSMTGLSIYTKGMDKYDYLEFLDSGNWTLFEDAFAEGTLKFHDYQWIIVEGKGEKAVRLFKDVTLLDPFKVTCKCCGQHYSIREYDSVFQATGYQRGCQYDKELEAYIEAQSDFPIVPYKPLEEFLKHSDVLIVYADGSTDRLIKERKDETGHFVKEGSHSFSA